MNIVATLYSGDPRHLELVKLLFASCRHFKTEAMLVLINTSGEDVPMCGADRLVTGPPIKMKEAPHDFCSKFYGWTLGDNDKILLLDADMFMLEPFDHIFDALTDDLDLVYTGRLEDNFAEAPIYGSTLLLRGSMHTHVKLRNFITEHRYSYQTGWAGSGPGHDRWVFMDEGIYWAYFLRKNKGTRTKKSNKTFRHIQHIGLGRWKFGTIRTFGLLHRLLPAFRKIDPDVLKGWF